MKNNNVYIIAGCNGSGKTTFARKFLPKYAECVNFVNADMIAQGLSPFYPEQFSVKAGKLVLSQIKEFTKNKIDFGFETTLSGKSYTNLFNNLKAKNYKLHLFYLWIPDINLAMVRIKNRVSAGGHSVPVKDIKRRFKRSIYNFLKIYRFLVDSWIIFDNSAFTPILISKYTNKKLLVLNDKLYDKIISAAR